MLSNSFAGYERPHDLAEDGMLPLTKRLDALKSWRAALARERAATGQNADVKQLDLELRDAIAAVTKELNHGP